MSDNKRRKEKEKGKMKKREKKQNNEKTVKREKKQEIKRRPSKEFLSSEMEEIEWMLSDLNHESTANDGGVTEAASEMKTTDGRRRSSNEEATSAIEAKNKRRLDNDKETREMKSRTERRSSNESASSEMLEIEYMLANMNTGPTTRKPRRDTTVSDTKLLEDKREQQRKRMATMVLAMSLEAEFPMEFYEQLIRSKRTKTLLTDLMNDGNSGGLVRKLYKCPEEA